MDELEETASGTQIDLSRAPQGVKVASALVAAVAASDDRVERHYLEVKSDLDLTKKNDIAKIAKFILGSANRLPRVAAKAFKGYGVMVVGVAPGNAHGVPPIEVLELEKIISQYLGASGPRWDVVRVPTSGSNEVLVFCVEPPEEGQDPFLCRKEGEALVNGRVYVRADGETREAKAEEMDLLLKRGKYQAAPEVSFAVGIVGVAHPVQLDQARSLDVYVAQTKAHLLNALPRPEPEATAATSRFNHDVLGAAAGGASARAMSAITAGSFFQNGPFGSDPETRTEAEYRESIEQWKRLIDEKWPEVPDILASQALDGVVIRVSNATKVFFHDVEVKIHLGGDVRGLDWRDKSSGISRSDLSLPFPPRVWGPLQRNPLNSGVLGAGQLYSAASMPSTYRSPLQWKNSGSVDLTLRVGDLRPRQTYDFDDDELVLVMPPMATGEVRGTWEITARDHNEIYSGELTVPVGPRADFTNIVRKLLKVE
ncbi:hypothetical protein [Agreia sp. VKM Ac-1783]|uniref:hypothetical protein n=1 Tax=Agreia sp. VKM Ac-1783 TaxID=1938889 RepID=UPI001483C1AC|nr:hypothetical protein [Agreia sp. VKM Ac-1783]